MENNLYNQINQNNFNNFGNLINKFNEFRNTFTGDPKQAVQQLMMSGRMSQQQFNQLNNMAVQFKTFLQR